MQNKVLIYQMIMFDRKAKLILMYSFMSDDKNLWTMVNHIVRQELPNDRLVNGVLSYHNQIHKFMLGPDIYAGLSLMEWTQEQKKTSSWCRSLINIYISVINIFAHLTSALANACRAVW